MLRASGRTIHQIPSSISPGFYERRPLAMLRFIKVTGQSLYPLYRDGDFVLIYKIPALFGRLHPGDVVVLHQAEHGTLIKIVDEIDSARGTFSVIGVDPGSVDSRQFGPVSRTDLVGKVIWHFARP